MRKQKPPKNRRKTAKLRAKLKARVKRRRLASPHGKRAKTWH